MEFVCLFVCLFSTQVDGRSGEVNYLARYVLLRVEFTFWMGYWIYGSHKRRGGKIGLFQVVPLLIGIWEVLFRFSAETSSTTVTQAPCF